MAQLGSLRYGPPHTGLFRRRSLALVLFLIPLTPHSATAQDCSSLDWDDVQGFRHCLQEHAINTWGAWTLHHAASQTSNPTIIRLLLDSGANPNTPDVTTAAHRCTGAPRTGIRW